MPVRRGMCGCSEEDELAAGDNAHLGERQSDVHVVYRTEGDGVKSAIGRD